MYKKILLTVDGSENARRAANEAARIAALVDNVEVDLVYVVVPPKTARELLLEPRDEEYSRVKTEVMDPILKIFNDKNKHITVNMVILNGEASSTILKYEKDNPFDLLIIGCRGLNAVQKFVQGSVSSKIVEKAKCPVLVIK